ncbi:MAG TPA: hypothetical protein VFX96_01750 [Pyrinomonadaceae bacterium]|nr:hypothetical protein [Pyrinomonadaceae bacterium]
MPNLTRDETRGRETVDALKGWAMLALTFIFVLLYGAALTGLLKPLENDRMVAHLEPIIFVIVGYYFGRMPSQQNEKTLKDEIGRQTQKADAAQHAKEQAQQARETLEEKVKNARAALAPAARGSAAKSSAESLSKAASAPRDEALNHSVAAALNILNS